MAEATSFFRWRPHPWHGLEVGRRPPRLVHAYVEITDLQEILIERLRHYFGTYKMVPGQESQMVVEAVYGRDHALKVVSAAMEDYEEAFC